MKIKVLKQSIRSGSCALLAIQMLACQVPSTQKKPVPSAVNTTKVFEKSRVPLSLKRTVLKKGGILDHVSVLPIKKFKAKMAEKQKAAPHKNVFSTKQSADSCDGGVCDYQEVGNWDDFYTASYNFDPGSCAFEQETYCEFDDSVGCTVQYDRMTFYGCDCDDGYEYSNGECVSSDLQVLVTDQSSYLYEQNETITLTDPYFRLRVEASAPANESGNIFVKNSAGDTVWGARIQPGTTQSQGSTTFDGYQVIGLGMGKQSELRRLDNGNYTLEISLNSGSQYTQNIVLDRPERVFDAHLEFGGQTYTPGQTLEVTEDPTSIYAVLKSAHPHNTHTFAIYDAQDNIVYYRDMGLALSTVWQGLSDNGVRLQNGNYTLKIFQKLQSVDTAKVFSLVVNRPVTPIALTINRGNVNSETQGIIDVFSGIKINVVPSEPALETTLEIINSDGKVIFRRLKSNNNLSVQWQGVEETEVIPGNDTSNVVQNFVSSIAPTGVYTIRASNNGQVIEQKVNYKHRQFKVTYNTNQGEIDANSSVTLSPPPVISARVESDRHSVKHTVQISNEAGRVMFHDTFLFDNPADLYKNYVWNGLTSPDLTGQNALPVPGGAYRMFVRSGSGPRVVNGEKYAEAAFRVQHTPRTFNVTARKNTLPDSLSPGTPIAITQVEDSLTFEGQTFDPFQSVIVDILGSDGHIFDRDSQRYVENFRMVWDGSGRLKDRPDRVPLPNGDYTIKVSNAGQSMTYPLSVNRPLDSNGNPVKTLELDLSHADGAAAHADGMFRVYVPGSNQAIQIQTRSSIPAIVDIKDAGGSIVHRKRVNAGTQSFSWDGKSDIRDLKKGVLLPRAVIMPDGVYTVELNNDSRKVSQQFVLENGIQSGRLKRYHSEEVARILSSAEKNFAVLKRDVDILVQQTLQEYPNAAPFQVQAVPDPAPFRIQQQNVPPPPPSTASLAAVKKGDVPFEVSNAQNDRLVKENEVVKQKLRWIQSVRQQFRTQSGLGVADPDLQQKQRQSDNIGYGSGCLRYYDYTPQWKDDDNPDNYDEPEIEQYSAVVNAEDEIVITGRINSKQPVQDDDISFEIEGINILSKPEIRRLDNNGSFEVKISDFDFFPELYSDFSIQIVPTLYYCYMALYVGSRAVVRFGPRATTIASKAQSINGILPLFAREAVKKYPYVSRIISQSGIIGPQGYKLAQAFKQGIRLPRTSINTGSAFIRDVASRLDPRLLRDLQETARSGTQLTRPLKNALHGSVTESIAKLRLERFLQTVSGSGTRLNKAAATLQEAGKGVQLDIDNLIYRISGNTVHILGMAESKLAPVRLGNKALIDAAKVASKCSESSIAQILNSEARLRTLVEGGKQLAINGKNFSRITIAPDHEFIRILTRAGNASPFKDSVLITPANPAFDKYAVDISLEFAQYGWVQMLLPEVQGGISQISNTILPLL